jgi:tetratricopeptide (TPR) repeat protein
MEQAAWMVRLDRERENIMGALGHSRSGDRIEAGLAMLYDLLIWLCASHLAITLRTCIELLDDPRAQARTAARAGACCTTARAMYCLGRYEEARRWLAEALEIAEACGDERVVMDAHNQLTVALLSLGDAVNAKRHGSLGLALALAKDDASRAANAANNLGDCCAATGEHTLALERYEQAMGLLRRGGCPDSPWVLVNLARTHIVLGANAAAARYLIEASENISGSSNVMYESCVLSFGSALMGSCGEFVASARFHGAALAHKQRTGCGLEPVDERLVEPLFTRAREALPPDVFDDAARAGGSLDFASALCEMSAWLEGQCRR